jgi:hypothetical protein
MCVTEKRGRSEGEEGDLYRPQLEDQEQTFKIPCSLSGCKRIFLVLEEGAQTRVTRPDIILAVANFGKEERQVRTCQSSASVIKEGEAQLSLYHRIFF